MTYHSSKQFIQVKKAELFKDDKTKEQLLLSDTTLECKELGRNVSKYNEDVWKRNVKKMCYPGLLAKFKCNKRLADMLLSTGNSHLAEASYDKVWGTGVPLKDQACLNMSNWSGTGILGEMLMDVRHDLFNLVVQSMDTTESRNTELPVSQPHPNMENTSEESVPTAGGNSSNPQN